MTVDVAASVVSLFRYRPSVMTDYTDGTDYDRFVRTNGTMYLLKQLCNCYGTFIFYFLLTEILILSCGSKVTLNCPF